MTEDGSNFKPGLAGRRAVKIFTGLNGGEEPRTIPTSQWPDLVSVRQTHCKIQFREDCRALLFFIDDAAKNDWLGYGTREKYIKDGLGLDLELVPWAIEGLKRIDPDCPLGFDEAIVLGQPNDKAPLTQRGEIEGILRKLIGAHNDMVSAINELIAEVRALRTSVEQLESSADRLTRLEDAFQMLEYNQIKTDVQKRD
jgi:hypothetical protein